MKHNVGDVVRIKSKKWYDENKNIHGIIGFADGIAICQEMSYYCGKIAVIEAVSSFFYELDIDNRTYSWNDYMIDDGYIPEQEDLSKDCLISESPIDWEQRRYELAKSAMQGFCANPSAVLVKQDVAMSIHIADEMIKQLKGEEE